MVDGLGVERAGFGVGSEQGARAGDDLALGWASLYKGWAQNSLGDREGAITALNESALAFDRAAYVAGAAQARSIATQAMHDAV